MAKMFATTHDRPSHQACLCGQTGFYIQRKETFMNRNVGFLLLAIWLILTGLSAFAALGGLGPVLAILAIASGIFILMGR
jgi:hypothetical protein